MLLVVSGVAAQQAVNYLIRGISSKIIGDQIAVEFTVINGGDQSRPTQPVASVRQQRHGRRQRRPSSRWAQNQNIQMILTVPLAQFTPGTSQTLYAGVGIDQLPPPNAAHTQQYRHASGRDPAGVGAARRSARDRLRRAAALPHQPERSDQSRAGDWHRRGGVVLLWVLTVIGRLMFSRPPTLPAWQPPYVITPLIDPNSTNGRRQLWQQHAESDILPAPCAPGDYKVRKLLIGSSGVKLAGWRVTGLRISQYDRYGRVARSQTVLPKKTVKALDRAVRKSASLDWERAHARCARPRGP